ncbi:hypothetical protein [Thermoactinomyces sp. CICC 10522]|uniref:hypothetical protein n=1 Tax=Thermoactinomyces sp. CICC 10522 TaxID=2767427 RepID=UPI0018DC280F|nr:hypothetical protein [Thermoactinomyces sp. CICC 10522]MBH8605110.1 hypothetical protein [Thermoactinomyces sp. CICC 10522]
MEVIQLKNPETWANRGGVRKITDKLNNIKEYSERWINKYTSGERIETALESMIDASGRDQ